METQGSAAHEKERIERRASDDTMRLLTGGLTHEGSAFLIGVGAVVLFVALYPLADAWALLAFPLVFLGAVLTRSKLHQPNR